MIHKLGTLAVLALAAPAAEAGPIPSSSPAASATVIQMKPWRTRWAIEAEIGGKKGLFLFDSGAGLTLVSKNTLARSGCQLWGRTTGYTMMGIRGQGPHCEGVPLTIGGIRLEPPMLGPIEMGEANPRDAELDGVIGLNLFEGRTLTIDFAAGTLTLETDASRSARVAAMRPLPIRLKREVDGRALAVVTAVPTTKGALWMELDSGNGGTVLVSKPVAELVGMSPTLEGKQRADFAVIDDVRATTDDAFTPDMIMDGNLGMPFLRNWVVTLDLDHARAWIGRSPKAPVVETTTAAAAH